MFRPLLTDCIKDDAWLEKGWVIRDTHQDLTAIGGGQVTAKLWLSAAGLIFSTVGLFIGITMQNHNALESLCLLFNFMQLVT